MSKSNENHEIEYKSIIDDNTPLEREVVSFLNSCGGTNIYWNRKNGHAIGVKDIDDTMLNK
ncbi:MAG: ATP-binding protein [Endomicrobium sp.]|jgi:hypothetical protein|nr:ATP-binding protein [Endomicrobium sp.]